MAERRRLVPGKPDATVLGTETVFLDSHPSVVFQLGEDLITDEVQALVELVKNAYDADSGFAVVTVDTTATSQLPELPKLVGYVEVVDGGTGMTHDEILRGWLTISNSWKRKLKAGNGKTGKGRTPLGDKGLGRLGAQRLGEAIEIDTRSTSGERLRVVIPWARYASVNKLSDVGLSLQQLEPTQAKGTWLTVHGLRDASVWTGQGRERLQRELSTMISPFKGRTDFAVDVTIDGKPLDLAELPERLRQTAQLRYHLTYRHGVLDVTGRARIEYWRPPPERPTEERADFDRLLAADGGKAFLAWFMSSRAKQAEQWSLRPGDGGWFVEYAMTATLSELDGRQYVLGLDDEQVLADPGDFRGEVDAFSLASDRGGLFGSNEEYREYFKGVHGIRVYRDGFGIRVPDDWLALSKRWSSGASYYNLKPSNVLGFIDLTAEGNACLQETTDREGFRHSPYYANFLLLLERWRTFTERVQTQLRRSYLEYRQEQSAAQVDDELLPPPRTAEQIAARLRERLHDREKEGRRASEAVDAVQRDYARLTASLGAAPPQDRGAPTDGHAVRRLRERIGELAAQTQAHAAAVEDDRALVESLAQQVDMFREQMALAYEAIALGLTAEALTHEVHHVADRLAHRTTQIRRELRADGSIDRPLSRYLDEVRSTASALNRQLAHFDPALRFAREQRQRIRLGEFARDVANYYNARWVDMSLPFRVQVVVTADFEVSINLGKLTQVLDNLLLNSEYWLRSAAPGRPTGPAGRPPGALPLGYDTTGGVTIEVKAPQVLVSDTGPGIDLSVEATLFDPFVTAKARGEGRGLGLFVVTQLLAPEGACVRLLPGRNTAGRLHAFSLDFSGAHP